MKLRNGFRVTDIVFFVLMVIHVAYASVTFGLSAINLWTFVTSIGFNIILLVFYIRAFCMRIEIKQDDCVDEN